MTECDDRQIKFCGEKFDVLGAQINRIEALIRENFNQLVSSLNKIEADVEKDINDLKDTLMREICAVESDAEQRIVGVEESNNRMRAIIIGEGTSGLIFRVSNMEKAVQDLARVASLLEGENGLITRVKSLEKDISGVVWFRRLAFGSIITAAVAGLGYMALHVIRAGSFK